MRQAVIFILSALLISACSSKVEEADMIITNGKIYSVDNQFNTYQAMVIREGKIVELGNNPDLVNKYQTDRIIDLEGSCVYPGFIDPHCHFFGYGSFLQTATLTGTKSFEEIMDILKSHATDHTEGWVLGRGWDQNDWEVKAFPDRSALDELFPERPVLLIRIDGHAALVNSVAIEKAGITPSTRVDGGEVEIKDGKISGILIDNAINLVQDKVPEADPNEIRRSLLDSQEKCFAVGLTSVHDAGLEKKVIDLIREMHDNGELKMKIYAMLSPTEENLDHYLRQGILRTDRLSIRSVKLFMDGALGSRAPDCLNPTRTTRIITDSFYNHLNT